MSDSQQIILNKIKDLKMPIIKKSDYKPPLMLKNRHLQTLFPSLFRKIKDTIYSRERIFTPDDDFIDIDWIKKGSDRAVIICHGLEGNSERAYVKGMAKAFINRGWDSASYNFRGCSGETNRQLRFYHSGATDDLHTVITHIKKTKAYKKIALVGFSLGGNIVLKYFGEKGSHIDKIISAGAAASVPCDLTASSIQLAKKSNYLYMLHFLIMLKEKIKNKMELYPDKLSLEKFSEIKTFKQYDDRYTAPIHGFKSAEDYWTKCSSKQFLNKINKPVLLINALDDPFLSSECYPFDEAEKNKFFHLETPKIGGHLGFVNFPLSAEFYHEIKIADFVTENS
jgi:predicted alpha/beta-fold hydrolase